MSYLNKLSTGFRNSKPNSKSKSEVQKHLLHLPLLLATLLLPGLGQADSSVWRVTAGDNQLYLGGTVHLLRVSDYPLPAEFEEAYADSDEIVFETDINSMNDLSTQARMMSQLTYQDERTLESVLNAEAWQALEEYTATVGLPLAMMQKFKPGMVVSTLQVMEFQKMGFTPQGVDAYFNTRAMGDGKPIIGLETIDEQIGFLADMGVGKESEFILLSLSDLEDTEAMMEEMISAWRAGDADALTEMFVEEMREQAPELHESLLSGRNYNWMEQIETMLADADTEFVLVGAAHLVGSDGLVELLRERGYEVEKL